MIIKGLNECDIVNYKKSSMFIIFPYCTFKCDKESNGSYCQNSSLARSPNISVTLENIVYKYVNNPLTEAIVFGGLEPMDSWEDVKGLVQELRQYTDDDIVIYTGYNRSEVQEKLNFLQQYKNIIIKFGRFIPNDCPHFDSVLGVNLSSSNQYAEKIS